MRRIALIDPPRDRPGERILDETSAWLRRLPIGALTRVERVADARLDQTDVVWLRTSAGVDSGLEAWLHRGGRLLATHDGATILSSLGLEPASPVELPFPDPAPAGFGLAGFGSHPLFTGLRDGASLAPWNTRASESMYCYTNGRRPDIAGVVAVERRGLDVHASTVLAWELAVGAGGVLCLAFDPALRGDGGRREAEVVLANALLGDAIPHHDRAGPVILWPPPGRCAVVRMEEAPRLTAPADAWPGTSLPLLDLTPASAWMHAGRRMLVSARPAGGYRDVWAPPFRVMRDATVRGGIPCAPGHLAADEVAGGLAIGGHRLLERWVAAADVPLVVWDIGGPEGIELVAEWEVDLRRSWPYPEGAYGDLDVASSSDGLSLRTASAGGPRVMFAVRGGRLEAVAVPGRAAVQISCRAVTPLRIVAVAGVDPPELERAVRVLERDGVREVAAARARRAAQLQRYGTAFEAPDELLARGFDWARQRGDEALIGVPGVGRSMLTACPRAPVDAWCFGTRACTAAAALLVAGARDPARELLKFLAQAQHPGGGIPASYPFGGLASSPSPEGTRAFLELAERLLAWAGDEDGVRRLGESITQALAFLAEVVGTGPSERVLDALENVAGRAGSAAIAALRPRALAARAGDRIEPHAIVEAAAAALRRAPGALHGTGAAPALLESVAALWGLEPDAPAAALSVTPALPSGWNGFALRRLRVGRSLLDLEVRRRPQSVVLRVGHLFGPRLVLTVGLRGVEVESTEVDEVPLSAPRVRFETHDRHEVRFHVRG